MEDRELVTKAMLECYAYIDDMYDALTQSIEKRALDGFYAIYAAEQFKLYEQIMKYNDRKVGLYNMKYLIEEGLARTPSYAGLLRAKYLEKKSVIEIAKERDLSLRTCYRRIGVGLTIFTGELEKMGFGKKRLLKEFGNEPLFSSMLNRVIAEDDETKTRAAKEAHFEALSRNNRHNPRHRGSAEHVSARPSDGAFSA